jgi:hypothetical protein
MTGRRKGDEFRSLNKNQSYAQTIHVLYRSYASSLQHLEKNVNIMIDLLILGA